jgi:enoyl-CoA hydratase/carnithine racemase
VINLNYQGSVAIISMNNPAKLNALSNDFMTLMHELVTEAEKKANALVICGGQKAFAAGVDVREIQARSYEEAYLENFIDDRWECIWRSKIPVIAAVSGYALGGGFELALMCDIIVAAPSAVFGFPEVNLGVMPGMGGTQMLTRIVGSKIASEIILTGRRISANEAKSLKILSKITEENEDVTKAAIEIAEDIASKSPMSARMIKEAIRMAQNTGISEGMQRERQMFRSLFSTKFKQEGMAKFHSS